jgi:hypothetical protein
VKTELGARRNDRGEAGLRLADEPAGERCGWRRLPGGGELEVPAEPVLVPGDEPHPVVRPDACDRPFEVLEHLRARLARAQRAAERCPRVLCANTYEHPEDEPGDGEAKA